MIKTNKKLLIFIFSLFFFLFISLFTFLIGKFFVISNSQVDNLFKPNCVFTIVLDAGHGGRDGGASENGVYEKDINLNVAKKIKDFLAFYNVDVLMTRESDHLLADDNSKNKKRDDLLNRLKIAKEASNPIFVSIHTNKFSDSRYKGLQVFYSPNNKLSESAAILLQTNIKEKIQQQNNRLAVKSNSSIYLLDRLYCPAILIECGFISNKEELELLSDDSYVNTIAYIISSSLIEFINI